MDCYTKSSGESEKAKESGDAIMIIGKVSDYLKFTERTIYRLASARKIPASKVEGSWRFSRIDIDGWIKRHSMEVIEPNRKDSGEML